MYMSRDDAPGWNKEIITTNEWIILHHNFRLYTWDLYGFCAGKLNESVAMPH